MDYFILLLSAGLILLAFYIKLLEAVLGLPLLTLRVYLRSRFYPGIPSNPPPPIPEISLLVTFTGLLILSRSVCLLIL